MLRGCKSNRINLSSSKWFNFGPFASNNVRRDLYTLFIVSFLVCQSIFNVEKDIWTGSKFKSIYSMGKYLQFFLYVTAIQFWLLLNNDPFRLNVVNDIAYNMRSVVMSANYSTKRRWRYEKTHILYILIDCGEKTTVHEMRLMWASNKNEPTRSFSFFFCIIIRCEWVFTYQ